MTRRLLHIPIAILLVIAIGSHSALVQSVAWVRMAVDYSRSAPLREALRMTFDGRHPCTLCKIAQAGKNAEHEKYGSSRVTKLDLLCRFPGPLLIRPPALSPHPGLEQRVSPRIEPPPIPPPRQA